MRYEDIKPYNKRCEKFQGIVTNERLMEVLIDEIEELRAYVEQSLKPVAWIFTWYEIAKDRHVRRIIDCEEKPNIPGYDLIPLYTSPPPRKPLTDEEILLVLRNIDPETKRLSPVLKALVQEIEAAHNIGEKG